MTAVWKASDEVYDLLESLKCKYHAPRLEVANISVCFEDAKPYIKGKINLGKVSKFSPLARLWQGKRLDFNLSIPADIWKSILKLSQREAYLDLLLSRCSVEYLPEYIEENGKKKPVKDEWGCIKYSSEIKLDEEGNPKWRVIPLDLELITDNIRRNGLWLDELKNLAAIVRGADGS